ncbi:MarR family winged helix-turn-helix transcriptional regulator [Dactylosporangium sp. CA-233914]|uniref:MarR family winged helix-turn-helix transcriptional regulator n=1 Tax=Dactylosporangium sp. CA-233914 TaxID=3239934 RepID=UPI003D94D7CA
MTTAVPPGAAADDDTAVPLVVAVWHLARRVRSNAERVVLAGSGLTVPDFVVLHLISSQPQVRVLDLCRQIAVAKATLSDILAKLSRRGFVSRERPATDRRTVVLSCTPAGRALVAEMAESLRVADRTYVRDNDDLIVLCAALSAGIAELDTAA